MGTLSSELAPHAGRVAGRPRFYADANLPARLVEFMRQRLQWDVLFVMEEDDLRRASDRHHYRLARQLRRTLLTLDRDYLDDRRFPPDQSGGVLVLWAPNEPAYHRLLKRLDVTFFQDPMPVADRETVPPLAGRKLHLHADWTPSPSRA